MITDAEIHRRQRVPGLEVTLQVNVQRRSKRTGWRLHPLFVKNVLQHVFNRVDFERHLKFLVAAFGDVCTVSV